MAHTDDVHDMARSRLLRATEATSARPAWHAAIGAAGRDRFPAYPALRAAIGALAQLPTSTAGFPAVRPEHFRRVTEALASLARENWPWLAAGDRQTIALFEELAAALSATAIGNYPNESVRLRLVEAEIWLAARLPERTLALSGPIARRPYLVEGDWSMLCVAFELDTLARLATGELDEVASVAGERLRYMARWQPWRSGELFERLFPALAVGACRSSRRSVVTRLVGACARERLRIQTGNRRNVIRRAALAVSRRLCGVTAASVLLASSVAERHRRMQLDPGLAGTRRVSGAAGVLVTRAMGGLGDLIMMTPGLHALARETGEPVHFATRRQFFPVFENNPDVRLLDIDGDLDVGRFNHWYNLSICPAGQYESMVRPHVRKGRVELFAAGMGIRRRVLMRHGMAPRCHLSEAQIAIRDATRARFAAAGLPIVGVQPYSRDSYKVCPGIFAAIASMAQAATVMVFHSASVSLAAHPNIVLATGRPLHESIAMVAACDYFMAVDTAFYHFAAAFDIPALGLFGPTSGETFSLHHARHMLVRPPPAFTCAPCWRNEDMPCYLTGRHESACLASIAPDDIVRAMAELMRRHPMARPTQAMGRQP